MKALIAVAAFVLAPWPSLSGQSAVALEAGVITAFQESATFQIGGRVTIAQPRSPGVDFAIATFPEAVAQGLFLFTPDLSVTVALPIGGKSWVLPRIGFSVLAGVFDGDAEAIAGFNVGIGVLGATSERMGVRMDLTHRRYVSNGQTSGGLLVVTVGIAWLR